MFDPTADANDLGLLECSDNKCTFCDALHWPQEINDRGLYEKCCKGGDVQLEPFRPPPPYLRSLLTGQDPEGRDFRKNIRMYNNAFAFTSCSYTQDSRVAGRGGVHPFTIHGQLFHYSGPLDVSSQDIPKFAQLYLYDPRAAADIRQQSYSSLNPMTTLRLTDMLHDCNPHIKTYKTAKEQLTAVPPADRERLRILINPQMTLIVERGADKRRENLRTADDVAILCPDELDTPGARDLILAVRDPEGDGRHYLNKVHPTHGLYMPLHYVMLLPHGDPGFHWGLRINNAQGQRADDRMQQLSWYRYHLHLRKPTFQALFYCQRLLQQFIVDSYACCESTRLSWIRRNQKRLRADVYKGVADAMLLDDADPAQLGRKQILPSSYHGGDRFMQQKCQDSLAIVRKYGKPTFFITFTANPYWPEIQRELFPGQQAGDRPDICCRVFFLKTRELLRDLKRGVLGKYQGHVYTIEYQKRGLPHMHLLLFTEDTYDQPELIDQVVCAELPHPSWDLLGRYALLVTSQLCHGPCGLDNPDAVCMSRTAGFQVGACSKRFPKPYCPATEMRSDGYPQYRRRNDGRTFTTRKPGSPGETVVRDNQWVVPYNPWLLQKYESHINVELCGTVQAIKYIHKYIYKGSDRTTLKIDNPNDEIECHLQARYIGPYEAMWRIMSYPTHEEFPTVYQLAVHLPDEQTVYFDEDIAPEELSEMLENMQSTLTGYLKYNQDNEGSRSILYSDFPWTHTWHRTKGRRYWAPRKRGHGAIGRMYHCSPVAGDRFYLRLLLTVVPGPTSFEDLRTCEGVVYDTFRLACIARQIVEDDKEWVSCFEEAADLYSGASLRQLFIVGLTEELISDPTALWDRFKANICDDLEHSLTR